MIPIERFTSIVGAKNAITDAADMARYTKDWRGHYDGASALVLRPSSAQEVSDVLKIAHETGTPIVPQSGNTGLVGGSTPSGDNTQVVVSLDRMTRIIEVDAANYSMTVEAGAILSSIHNAADAADRLFPLSLASEGTCRIGGNLSTNAGGLNVLSYGNTRELCLGLEVVLADGRIWDGQRKLRKDNTGYDLKNVFIGSEGTLGVITAAVLRLFPKPRRFDSAFVAVPQPQAAVDLLSLAKESSGSRVVTFELISNTALDLAVCHAGARLPLPSISPWYVLVELADALPDSLQGLLESALERRLATDATIAQSQAQRMAMRQAREAISDAQKHEGDSIKNDVSVPISRVPDLISRGTEAVLAIAPDARPVIFGHLGDGNIHFNISQPKSWRKGQFLALWDQVTDAVQGVALSHGGSISAEHGIGRMKRDKMKLIKTPVELQLMRDLKRLLDPKGILNPGKVLPD